MTGSPPSGMMGGVDLAYLRANPHLLPTLLAHQRLRTTPVTGGSICTAERITLDDGVDVFIKTWPGGVPDAPNVAGTPAPEGFFAAEARGLQWLGETPGGACVPDLIAATDALVLLEWVDHAVPSAEAAEEFGRQLAAIHRAGAPHYGAENSGYLGTLPLDNTPGDEWGEWYRAHRIAPYLKISVDNGTFDAAEAAWIENLRIEAPAEPPARIHGNLWPGNVLWGTKTAWLIDPAAHGGHRESDVAALHLFGGAPYLDRIIAAYQEIWPLAEGWQERIALQQLPLLLAHTAISGDSFKSAVLRAAEPYR